MNLALTFPSHSPDDTVRLAAAIAKRCVPGDCLALHGDLGMGKTAFARGFIQALCGTETEVTSPTFTIAQHYESTRGVPIWHYDLYRIEHAEELRELALEEALEDSICLIEWPEIAEPALPAARLEISIRPAMGDSRNILVHGSQAWYHRLHHLL